jgi:hypothetical protein
MSRWEDIANDERGVGVEGYYFDLFKGAFVTHLILPEQSCTKEKNNKTGDTQFYIRSSLAALPK